VNKRNNNEVEPVIHSILQLDNDIFHCGAKITANNTIRNSHSRKNPLHRKRMAKKTGTWKQRLLCVEALICDACNIFHGFRVLLREVRVGGVVACQQKNETDSPVVAGKETRVALM
jgi:hypothetical protein